MRPKHKRFVGGEADGHDVEIARGLEAVTAAGAAATVAAMPATTADISDGQAVAAIDGITGRARWNLYRTALRRC